MTVKMPDKKRLIEIIELCKKNNRKAQMEIFNLFSQQMFVVCLRYSTSNAHAENMLQEGFLKVYDQIAKYDPSDSFVSWMKRIIANTCIADLRKKPNLYALIDRRENTLENFDLAILDELMAEDVLRLIQDLPIGYKIIFNMFVIEAYQHKEIAKKLNISVDTSKSQLKRARNLILKNLTQAKYMRH